MNFAKILRGYSSFFIQIRIDRIVIFIIHNSSFIIKKMNYTKHTLQKIEELFEELKYVIRYEKGSFQSGYCLVENRNIAVVNKFFETESRINTLIDILDRIEVNTEGLSEKALKTLKEVRKKKLGMEMIEVVEEDVKPENS